MFSSVPTISRIFYPAFFLIFIGTSALVSAQIWVEPVGSDVRPGLPEVFGGKGAGGCCDGSHKPGEAGPVSFAAMEYETYRVSATYYSLNDGLTTTLMLNNKGPQPILATPTFYSLAGTRLTLAPITVPATSYIDVDMHQLLSGAGAEFREGSLKISYSGISLQLGAQVKMVDEQNGLIWAEQLVYPSKFVSNRLENVWLLPGGGVESYMVVSNTTYSPVTLAISVDGTNPQQTQPVHLTLNPSETRVLDILADLAGSANGSLRATGGISITHTGGPGAILARMYAGKPGRGYSASIAFVDPENTASQKWHGNGLRLRNLDGQALDPELVVRNTSNQISQVQGRIPYTRPNGDVDFVQIPSTTIGPNTTASINLKRAINRAHVPSSVSYGGFEFEYSTPKGTVIASLQSVSPNGEHVFQVPLMDPEKMPASAGGFPWKADGDFRTVVYIKNETDTEREYTAYLTYEGGQYVSGIRKIKAHETVAIDFRTIRDEQIPDVNGVRIPMDVEHGQIAWSARGIETRVMSGRSEQISLSKGVASTYACYSCCIMRHHSSWVSQSAETINIGGTASFTAWQRDEDCYTVFAPYEIGFPTWTSSNSAVASVSGGSATGNSPGSANIQAGWWTNETIGYEVCEPYSQYVTPYAPLTVLAPTVQVTEVGFTGDHPIHKWPPPGTAIDSPDGTSPTWKSTSNPNDPVSYTKASNITMFSKLSISPSIPERNVKIRVKNGSTAIANKDAAISGTTANVSGVSTTSVLESTVKKTTPTFDWEISYNNGSTWSSIGSTGPHTIYWTYSTPLSPPFENDIEILYPALVEDPALYDKAFELACDYSFGESVPAFIIWNINEGVELDINYNPSISIGDKHPLEAYSTPGGCQCSDHANLLRGLLRTIGIDGTTLLIWAGPDSNTLSRYKVGSTGNTNSSFRIIRAAHDSAGQNPHFKFHAVVSTNGTWYDPSYGMEYSILSFNETAFNNTGQQISSSFWTDQPFSGFECGH